jgi:hypothetical protein
MIPPLITRTVIILGIIIPFYPIFWGYAACFSVAASMRQTEQLKADMHDIVAVFARVLKI